MKRALSTVFVCVLALQAFFVCKASAEATSTPPLPLGFDQYNSEHIKARVQAFFPDLPVMVAIADCESEFRQFDHDTSLLRGGGGTVVGIFQINEAIHRPLALTLGLDISSIDGNILYARHMYEEDGIYPWLSSFPCWNPKIHPTATSTASENPAALLTKDFHLGVVNPEVLVLQQILNHNSFPIADSGPGSPGNETTSYGIRTRNAVRLFQCTKLNICSGDESTTASIYDLRSGHTKSCGCLSAERLSAMRTKHGRTGTPEYKIWRGIRARCYNANSHIYPYYGGRGIVMCERWHASFDNFFTDMGERPSPQHSVERIDNDGPYAPDNCRWATRTEQGNNTRQNHYVTYDGKTMSVADWARHLGIDYSRLLARLERGVPPERAFASQFLERTEWRHKKNRD
jgi:hypothetical protein